MGVGVGGHRQLLARTMQPFFTGLVLAILITVAYFDDAETSTSTIIDPSEKFYDMQEDGTILCETKADCPADVPGQVNNTVLEFACEPRIKVDDWKLVPIQDGTEPIILYEEWYKTQTVCGEEFVNTCCTEYSEPVLCEDYDVKNLCKNNTEVYGGTKPEFQVVSALKKVDVKVPEKYRQTCEPGQCKRRKRVKQRGVIDICCDVVLVRGIYSCPSRRNRKAVCNEFKS